MTRETTLGVLGKRQLFGELDGSKPESNCRGSITFNTRPPEGQSFKTHLLNFIDALMTACRFVLPDALECELIKAPVRVVSGRFGIRLLSALPHFTFSDPFVTHKDKAVECGQFYQLRVFEDPAIDANTVLVVDDRNGYYATVTIYPPLQS